MTTSANDLETLVANGLAAVDDPAGEASPPDTGMRERFFELMVLILANLYAKTPVAAPLIDRTTMLRVTEGMDDNDAGRLTGRAEDWLRLEGLLRQQDGAKAYFVTRPSLAVLSTLTAAGPLGDVMGRILKRYQEAMPSAKLRAATRMLGSYFLTRVARS